MNKILSHFKALIKKKGMRYTKQREAVLKMFLDREGHVCADELYYALRRKYRHIGRATVYRTVKLLKQAKLAYQVNFTDRRRRFEHAFEHPHHDHFICQECGKVIEFFDRELEKRQELICKKFGFSGEDHEMKIFGLCKKCQRKMAK
ncbi:MAG: Fur family transcriptional regulator [bacterium]